MISHSNPLSFVLEVQLEINLDRLPLKIRGSGRLPADLFHLGVSLRERDCALRTAAGSVSNLCAGRLIV